jgi:uncharacterized protein
MEKGRERIAEVDILRGVALFGILYAHFIFWYTASALPVAIYYQHMNTVNGLAMLAFGALVFGKFFSIFSFLFGFSLSCQLEKKSALLTSAWVGRMVVLLGIGFLHHLFWRGDILMIYGMLGILLLPLGRLHTGALLVVALLLVFNVPVELYALATGLQPPHLPLQESADSYYHSIRYGTLPQVMLENLSVLPGKLYYQVTSGRLSVTLGFMALGLYAGRTGLVTRIVQGTCPLKPIVHIALALLVLVTVPLVVAKASGSLPVSIHNMFDTRHSLITWWYNMYNAIVSVLYMAGVLRATRVPATRPYIDFFRYPGKIPMTTYLVQSAFGLLLFYQLGAGLFSHTTPAINILLTIPVFVVQVWMSRWWLQYFRHGPAEWVWRTLSQSGAKAVPRKETAVIHRS